MEKFLKVCTYILAIVWGAPYTRYFLLTTGPEPLFAIVTALLVYIAIAVRNDPWIRAPALVAAIIVGTYFYYLGEPDVCYPR